MSKQKKKFNFTAVIGIAAALLIGGSIGFFGAQYIDTLTGGDDKLFFIYLGVMLAGLYLAFILQIIIHEAGHLIFGLMSDYQFVSFNIMGLIWQKDASGKLRLGRMQLAGGAAGQCLMAPPDYNGGDFPFTLYNLGGVMINLICAALCALLAWRIPSVPVRILLIMQSLVGVAFALLNGLPLPLEALQNDGKNQQCICKDDIARRAFWVQMSIAAGVARGVRLREMPEDWFAPLPEEALDNAIVCAIPVLNTTRLMDQLDFAAAEQEIRTLLARKKGVVGLYRTSMTCDGAVCELIAGQPGTLVSSLEDKEHQAIIKTMKSHPSILRTQYALALLKDRDEAKAEKLLASFEAAAKKHPNPQEITGEREILAAIQAAAQHS